MKKNKGWTIDEIAKANKKAGRHYFDEDTLRFFGQCRHDFHVYERRGRVWIFASTHANWDCPGLSSFAEFFPDTGRTGSVKHPEGKNWTQAEVEAYVCQPA